MNNAPELKAYYKAFGVLKGALTALGILCPLLSAGLQHDISRGFFFPPIGDSTLLAASVTSAMALAASTYGYFTIFSGRSTRACTLFLSALVCGVIYVTLASLFIVRIPDPVSGDAEYITRGYQRTSFADRYFVKDDDVEMVMRRGTEQVEIDKLWTLSSLTAVRMSLVISSMAFFTSLSAFWSLLVARSLRLNVSTTGLPQVE